MKGDWASRKHIIIIKEIDCIFRLYVRSMLDVAFDGDWQRELHGQQWFSHCNDLFLNSFQVTLSSNNPPNLSPSQPGKIIQQSQLSMLPKH